MYKKPILSACAAPWLPSLEDSVMGWRWKRDFEEGMIHPFLLQRRRRRGIRAEALDTARDVKTHPYSSFPIMHLAPSKCVSEGDFTPYLISPQALLSETDHIPSVFATLSIIFTSLWWQLRLQSFAASFLKKMSSLDAPLLANLLNIHDLAPASEVEVPWSLARAHPWLMSGTGLCRKRSFRSNPRAIVLHYELWVNCWTAEDGWTATVELWKHSLRLWFF